MFKFFKRLIWRLKHRNINLSDLRKSVEYQTILENIQREDISYVDRMLNEMR